MAQSIAPKADQVLTVARKFGIWAGLSGDKLN